MTDFPELEAALKELRPAAPSAELITRVQHSLGESTPTAAVLPRRPRAWVNWSALGFGLAAAAAAILLLARANVDRIPRTQPRVAATTPGTSPEMSQPTHALVPDGLTRVVYNRSDEGLVYPSDASAPVRRVRSHSRETLQWKDRGTGASLRVSYPTQEVELIPISGQ